MKHLIFVLALLTAAPLYAQTPVPAVPVSVNVYVLPAAGSSDTAVAIGLPRNTPISATSSDCNLTAPAAGTGTLVNPTTVYFDDPFHAGKQCRGFIPLNLPNGSGYRAVVTYIAASCTDPNTGQISAPCESARSVAGVPPFDVTGLTVRPVAPTGAVVRP